MTSPTPRFATIEKEVGETPLITTERLRKKLSLPEDIPLAYAGRLDPMASGKLLVLIGNECRVQERYHAFDKRYVVEVLFGARSDTGDVLGLIEAGAYKSISAAEIKSTLAALHGRIELPYPHFSSKTVGGKPLHIWTLEKRLHEIEIPKKTSQIYALKFHTLRTVTKSEVLQTVRTKIETIPHVTEVSKALGADFRRTFVRASWNEFETSAPNTFQILTFSCIASSGTYMRSLAEEIGSRLGTSGLAYSIHRTHIGRYLPLFKNYGIWTRRF